MTSVAQGVSGGSTSTTRADEASNFPLISVGLPVFNGARFLEPCLDSILAQTYPHFELVISDNASTDETARICERYAARDARIRWERADRNRGAAWNHNHVWQLARGKYFRWCGADDIVDPRFLEMCIQALERRPDAVAAYPMTVVIDDEGRAVERTADRLDLEGADPAVRFGSLLRPWRATHNPFYGLLRTTALAGVRPIGAFLANDRSFMAELALRGPFVRVEEYLMFRRLHDEQARRTREVEQRFMDPEHAGGYWAREWIMLREHLLSAARAPAGLGVKLRLLWVVSAWAIEQRWRLAWEVREYAGHVARRVGFGGSRAAV